VSTHRNAVEQPTRVTDFDPNGLYLVEEIAAVARMSGRRMREVITERGVPVRRIGRRTLRVLGSDVIALLLDETPAPTMATATNADHGPPPIRRRRPTSA
jgi:hypothetical protein